MEYAKSYNIRSHPRAKAGKTRETAQAAKRICGMDATAKGCSRHKQRQKEISPATDVADDFLKFTFLPKLDAHKTIKAATNVQQTEDDFYRSLSAVAGHYRCYEPMDTRGLGYPYNIALSLWEAEDHLKRKVKNWDGIHLVADDRKRTSLMCCEKYDTGTSLYHIPVIPLFKMLHNKQHKKSACLLLSACSYLYHIADVPYYRQESSYLYWQYEMITEWIENDDEEDAQARLADLALLKWAGDVMERKLFNRKNLEVFAQRIKAFRPYNAFEAECLNIAHAACMLYRDYPATSVFKNAAYRQTCMDEDAADIILMEKYIGFTGYAKGWLPETLADTINSDFNECGAIEEPTLSKRFDGSALSPLNLDFEERLFPLIADIYNLLYDY